MLLSCMACTSPSLFHALYMIRLHASSHTYTNGQCRYPHSEYTSMQPVHIIMNAHAECTCMHACIPGVAQGSGYTSMQPAHILRVTNLHKMMMMMPFNYSYRNKNENVRTLSLAECTRMHACIHTQRAQACRLYIYSECPCM